MVGGVGFNEEGGCWEVDVEVGFGGLEVEEGGGGGEEAVVGLRAFCFWRRRWGGRVVYFVVMRVYSKGAKWI